MPPKVSVIVPCYNEEATIQLLLKAVYEQSYSHENMEVILADGMSSDQTREKIAQFCSEFPDLSVRVVDNPKRSIPSGLNKALAAAQGEYVIRLDAHCMPNRDYIQRSLQDLEANLGMNVGGVWEIRPGASNWQAESIAAAAAHPLGVGDALYRYASVSGVVDTVPFGAFRRQTLLDLGGYDESLLTNEDYELNVRLREKGGKVWLDPEIRSVYFSRPNFTALSRQYWRYGYWKFRMLQRYPKTLRWRQALPPMFVLSLMLWLILSFFWLPARWMLVVEALLYFSILFIGSLKKARQSGKPWVWLGIPIAIATMHVSWGTGFLWSLVQSIFWYKRA